jgi:hypothetical protein
MYLFFKKDNKGETPDEAPAGVEAAGVLATAKLWGNAGRNSDKTGDGDDDRAIDRQE